MSEYEKTFYTVHDVAAIVGLNKQNVYRYHQSAVQRNLSLPMPERWPLEEMHARRLIDFIQCRKQKNPRKKTGIRQD